MPQPTYLTPDGLTNLKKELELLRTSRRQEVAERIQKAKEIGGTVDNAEYEESKNEQAFIEGRILTLDNLINNAVVISSGGRSSDVVGIGSKVSVIDQMGKRQKYVIVGTPEADPIKGKISNVSPIGRALLGRRIGELAEADVPAGKITLEIIEIR